MPKVIILGSSNAVPSKDHENTHMVIVGKQHTILVDCVRRGSQTRASICHRRTWIDNASHCQEK